VLQDTTVFEKAGVNISVVRGVLPPAAAEQMRVRLVAEFVIDILLCQLLL